MSSQRELAKAPFLLYLNMINFYESTTFTEQDFIEALDFLSSDRGNNITQLKVLLWCYRLAKRCKKLHIYLALIVDKYYED